MIQAARDRRTQPVQGHRSGIGSLDYVLVLGIVLPLLAVILPISRRAMVLVYEMTTTLVAWPFM